MVNTKLILIEGLPGAGKSTTAEYLATVLEQRGIACRWFHELDDDNPVTDLDVRVDRYPQRMAEEWRRLVDHAKDDSRVTILESRLWQNSALFMYMTTYRAQDVRTFNRQIFQTLSPLAPVLLYLVQDETEAALRRLYTFRGDAWMQEVLEATTQNEWFRSRNLSDFAGWVQFFDEWVLLAEQLYGEWPYAKAKVANPHEHWPQAYETMTTFLHI